MKKFEKIYINVVKGLVAFPLLLLVLWLPFFPSSLPAGLFGNAAQLKYILLVFALFNPIMVAVLEPVRRYLKKISGESKSSFAVMIILLVALTAICVLTIVYAAQAYIAAVAAFGKIMPPPEQIVMLYLCVPLATTYILHAISLRKMRAVFIENPYGENAAADYARYIAASVVSAGLSFNAVADLFFVNPLANSYVAALSMGCVLLFAVLFCTFFPQKYEKRPIPSANAQESQEPTEPTA